MAEKEKKTEAEQIRALFKGMNEKLDKVCKGQECLPEISKGVSDLSKKVDGFKIPEAPAKPEKHNVFPFMTFCPECGEKVREEPPTFACKDCGVPVDPKTSKVCWNCGSKKAVRKTGELKLK